MAHEGLRSPGRVTKPDSHKWSVNNLGVESNDETLFTEVICDETRAVSIAGECRARCSQGSVWV